MDFKIFGKKDAPVLMLIPGLGVSYEIFIPLIRLLENDFHIIAVQVDGFIIDKCSNFTSIDDQAAQLIDYVKKNYDSRLNCAYGLSLGGKILSRVLERDEIVVEHAILDAAPLLPLPRWLIDPLRYLQCFNVWTCYHWTGFWRWLFHSHYFDVLLDECKKVYPHGGSRAVLDGYKSVYTNKLYSISGNDIQFWYGTKESFVAKPMVKHLKKLKPDVKVEIFKKMNHGQLLIDFPEEVAKRIREMKG